MCQALTKSGAGSSYASAKLISTTNKKPSEVETQRIDMLMATKTARVEMYVRHRSVLARRKLQNQCETVKSREARVAYPSGILDMTS